MGRVYPVGQRDSTRPKGVRHRTNQQWALASLASLNAYLAHELRHAGGALRIGQVRRGKGTQDGHGQPPAAPLERLGLEAPHRRGEELGCVPRADALAVQLEADVTLAEHGLVERTDDVDLEQLNVIGRVRLRQELLELPHRGVDVRKGSADQAAVRRLQHRDVLERPELGLVDAQLDQGRARWPEHRKVQPRGVRAAAAIRCPHHRFHDARLSFTLASKDIAPVYHARAYGGPDPVERGPFLFKNIRKSVVPGTRGARGQPLRNLRRNSPTPSPHDGGACRTPRPAPVMIRAA